MKHSLAALLLCACASTADKSDPNYVEPTPESVGSAVGAVATVATGGNVAIGGAAAALATAVAAVFMAKKRQAPKPETPA